MHNKITMGGASFYKQIGQVFSEGEGSTESAVRCEVSLLASGRIWL